ncbi:uncharacterized protein UDID_19373 [Ustilago sp. UG-2017a]|nr:uncharacterized protein UDID_19373 [Ustilago sp. UG-2017a]
MGADRKVSCCKDSMLGSDSVDVDQAVGWYCAETLMLSTSKVDDAVLITYDDDELGEHNGNFPLSSSNTHLAGMSMHCQVTGLNEPICPLPPTISMSNSSSSSVIPPHPNFG